MSSYNRTSGKPAHMEYIVLVEMCTCVLYMSYFKHTNKTISASLFWENLASYLKASISCTSLIQHIILYIGNLHLYTKNSYRKYWRNPLPICWFRDQSYKLTAPPFTNTHTQYPWVIAYYKLFMNSENMVEKMYVCFRRTFTM